MTFQKYVTITVNSQLFTINGYRYWKKLQKYFWLKTESVVISMWDRRSICKWNEISSILWYLESEDEDESMLKLHMYPIK